MSPGGHPQDGGNPLCDRHSVFCDDGNNHNDHGHRMEVTPWRNFENSPVSSDPSTPSLRGTHNPFFFFLLFIFAMIFLIIFLRSCCRICDAVAQLCPHKSPMTTTTTTTTTTSGGHVRPRLAPFTQSGSMMGASPPPSPAVQIGGRSNSGGGGGGGGGGGSGRRGHPHMYQRHSLPNYVTAGSLSSFRPISYLPSISEFDPSLEAPMWPSPQHQHQQTLPYGTFDRRTPPPPPVSLDGHHGDNSNSPPQPPAYTNPAAPPPSYAEAVLGSV